MATINTKRPSRRRNPYVNWVSPCSHFNINLPSATAPAGRNAVERPAKKPSK